MQHRCGERKEQKKSKEQGQTEHTNHMGRITGLQDTDYRALSGLSRATTGCLFEQKGLEMHTSSTATQQHHVVRCPTVTYRSVKWNLDLCRLIISLIQLVCWSIYQLQRSILVYSECNNVNVWPSAVTRRDDVRQIVSRQSQQVSDACKHSHYHILCSCSTGWCGQRLSMQHIRD